MKNVFSKILFGIFIAIVLTITAPVRADSLVVNNSMDSSTIQSILDTNDEVVFEEGTYTDLVLNVNGTKVFKTTGEVIFKCSSGNNFGIVIGNASNANITFNGSFTFSGYREGIYVSNNANVIINIFDNSSLALVNGKTTEQNHGSGIWVGGSSNFTINGGLNSTFVASDNAMAGINVLSNATFTANFKNMALVDMSRNTVASGYHSGMDNGINTVITFDNVRKVTMDDNGVDAVCFSNGSDVTKLNIINSNVSMQRNHSWGTNGGTIEVINSYLNISDNSSGPWANVIYTSSNMYADSLVVRDSIIDANGSGANSGIWVYGKTIIDNSTINANDNGQNAYGNYNYSNKNPLYSGAYPWNLANGLAFCGEVSISNSTITASNNGGAGIAFYGTSLDDIAYVTITSSVINANNNGVSPNFTVYKKGEKIYNWNSSYYEGRSGFNVALYSGIAICNSEVTAVDSTIMLLDNKQYGIGYHQLFDGKFVVDGKTIAAISTSDENLQREIKGSNTSQETIVLSGSLQGKLENMDGEYGDSWNGVKEEDEIYVGPVNSDGTKLVEFDVNKEINRVVKEDVNSFEYFDPNTLNKYEYTFKYNTIDTDLTKEGDNAYIWTPVSILHYDATEGLINYLGTAGVLSYGSSKALQEDLFLAGLDSRFTQDITIYGNSLALAEKIIATASREGYVFLGWYIADDQEKASVYALEGNFSDLYDLLNTEFTDMTKLELSNVPVSELTVYAKWAKRDTGKTDAEIVPPATGVSDFKLDLLLIILLVTAPFGASVFKIKTNI